VEAAPPPLPACVRLLSHFCPLSLPILLLLSLQARLIRYCLSRKLPPPEYVSVQVPDAEGASSQVSAYEVSCRVAGIEWGRGRDATRKLGEQSSARDALEKLGIGFHIES
jgi:dsRNA-specific ribonuclease